MYRNVYKVKFRGFRRHIRNIEFHCVFICENPFSNVLSKMVSNISNARSICSMCVFSWISTESCRYPWILMHIHGYPWISMDLHGYPWISMDIHGTWTLLCMNGHFRRDLDVISRLPDTTIHFLSVFIGFEC